MRQLNLFSAVPSPVFAAYDLIIVNSSGGKDSLAALYEIVRQAKAQGYPLAQIHVSHQDLGRAEWQGTKELVFTQAAALGIKKANVHVSQRRTKEGKTDDFLAYVERRKMWPSSTRRWCTSDFKRGPGARVVTRLTKGLKQSRVLYVMGFRAEESTARAKRSPFSINTRLTTKSRTVDEYYPIHEWTTAQVWAAINSNHLPYHPAYDLGMARLSCVFCIFAPFHQLKIAGAHNPELLAEYVATEAKIGHTFRKDTSLAAVAEALAEETQPVNF